MVTQNLSDMQIENKLMCIDNLNFSMVKMKMMDKVEGLGWSKKKCEISEHEYKRFLKLIALFPRETIVPSKMMDAFWHYHILDTRKYYADCINIFNEIVHHYPYFGMNGKEDAQNLKDTFEQTKKLYFETFLETMPLSIAGHCEGSSCGSRCGSKCKS